MGACLKIPYASRGAAHLAAKAQAGCPREYHCPHCGFWHLSSKSRREVKQRRKLR